MDAANEPHTSETKSVTHVLWQKFMTNQEILWISRFRQVLIVLAINLSNIGSYASTI
jgi:hypothetical protein